MSSGHSWAEQGTFGSGSSSSGGSMGGERVGSAAVTFCEVETLS